MSDAYCEICEHNLDGATGYCGQCYGKLQAENEQLKELLFLAEKAFHLVGSAVSGNPTSRKVERLLLTALNDIGQPVRKWVYENKKGQTDVKRSVS